MRLVKLLGTIALLGCCGAAAGSVQTAEPLAYAAGTDVSTAFGRATLTRLVNAPGTSGYAPALEPVLIGRCDSYGVCPAISPLGTLGGQTYNLEYYRTCYNANRVGLSSTACGEPFMAVQMVFHSPTDFVEFQLTWYSDPPVLLAYDAAGNEILACEPTGGFGTPAGCLTSYRQSTTRAFIGTIRIRAPAGRIAKVVVGSYLGSAHVTHLQYSLFKAPCP